MSEVIKMNKTESNVITLAVRGVDIHFEPTVQAYNSYINELMPDDKVAPSHNYLRRIVCADSKQALDDVLKLPGAAVQLAAKLNERYIPDLEIEVKN